MDPHFPAQTKTDIRQLLDSHLQQPESRGVIDKLKAYYYLFDSTWPYPEVRAIVTKLDDSFPVETFRAYFLGIVSGEVLLP